MYSIRGASVAIIFLCNLTEINWKPSINSVEKIKRNLDTQKKAMYAKSMDWTGAESHLVYFSLWLWFLFTCTFWMQTASLWFRSAYGYGYGILKIYGSTFIRINFGLWIKKKQQQYFCLIWKTRYFHVNFCCILFLFVYLNYFFILLRISAKFKRIFYYFRTV